MTTTAEVPAGTSNVEPPLRRHRVKPQQVVAQVLRYLALLIAAVIFLLPFYLIVRNALSVDLEITSPNWTLFPKTLHWENLTELFEDPSVNILRSLGNSAIVAVLQTAGQLLLSAMAGSMPSSAG